MYVCGYAKMLNDFVKDKNECIFTVMELTTALLKVY